MAKYPGVITTNAGYDAIAEANASHKALIFTKIVLGAGDMPASINKMTALVDKRLEINVINTTKDGNGQFTVHGALTNESLEKGFYAKEVGLIAKVGESGKELLFSYTNGGNYVDYIPDKTIPMDTYSFSITTVIGNAENVTAVMNNKGYVTVKTFNNHNNDLQAHKELLKLFLRLTGGTLTGDLGLIKSNINFRRDVNDFGCKIRIAENGNFDIGVTEDGSNKNATAQMMLHSQNKPKWYNSGIGGKELATVEELLPITKLLGQGAIVASKLDSNNGFVKFANGLMIQWGFFQNVKSGSTITFPIAFRNSAFSAVANDVNANDKDNQVHSLRDYTATSMKIFTQSVQDRETSNTAWGHYIVVGV